ncbi:hypothetical protein [Microvirga subterranea]|uniref:Uncharacterized protein n=1 Tax=Microvirga subterranea TaxID=186651 RepID=A0A370HIK8_9HYPH|nr:hypothetical protein [Microvirga subterranea]RDI57233.1 hypothetical protein DES45_107150 [Microvirga subterranea]
MQRNKNFDRFVQTSKEIAASKGLLWALIIDESGRIDEDQVWDLDRATGAPMAKKGRLRDLGADRRALSLLNEERIAVGKAPIQQRGLDSRWVDFLLAVAVDWVFIKKNRPGTLYDRRLRPLRILAAGATDVVPWLLTVDHVRTALRIASKIGESERAGVETAVAQLFDRSFLASNAPLLPLALDGKPRAQIGSPGKRMPPGQADLRSRLEDRKSAEKLPEMRAFWELVRIAFTEQPQTYLDTLRFDHAKIQICCGFRISESCTLPADWRRVKKFVTSDGRPAGEIGGISEALILRHFAAKQRGRNEDSQVLFEAEQPVPQIFEPIIEEAFDGILRRTEPLRRRLKQQTETGRLFPEFDLADLVPVGEFYPRLSGDLRLLDDQLPEDLVAEYKRTFAPEILDRLWETQLRPAHRLRKYAVNYFHQFGFRAVGDHGILFPARKADGSAWNGPVRWIDAYVRVGELEKAVREAMPRKLPDVDPHQLTGGRRLYPYEMLLLAPKAALAEERNGNILDVNRYFAIGTIDDDDFRRALGSKNASLFTRYGRTEEDRALSLTNTHALRHLQNTELFRLGLADTIITKRFNRRSVRQSYTYDHRSLAEDLDAIELPSKATMLPAKAQQALKLIKSGRVRGPITHEFERVQQVHGEDAALEFLAVEADGFHATPYGYCVNSFTVDPCPKHLECFNGCRSLVLSQNGEHERNLDLMERQLTAAIAAIERRPIGSVGRENQLADAQRKLMNVRAAKGTRPGRHPFPDGPDLSAVAGVPSRRTPLDGF